MHDRHYTVILHPDPKGGYTVTVPAWPGCVTQGETLEEAIVMEKDAIQLYIASLVADGEPAPPRSMSTHRPSLYMSLPGLKN